MTRFVIALALVLATSVPAFARAMPMAHAAAAVTICVDHSCAGHQNSGHSRQDHMASGCFAVACAGPVSLPASASPSVPIVDVAITYNPIAAPRRTGVRAVPDAPPPRSLALS